GPFTLPGARADERIAVRPSQLPELLGELALELGLKLPWTPARSSSDRHKQWLSQLAKDLSAHRGEALVIAGESLDPEAHALVHCINSYLNAIGKTLELTQEPMGDQVAC